MACIKGLEKCVYLVADHKVLATCRNVAQCLSWTQRGEFSTEPSECTCCSKGSESPNPASPLCMRGLWLTQDCSAFEEVFLWQGAPLWKAFLMLKAHRQLQQSPCQGSYFLFTEGRTLQSFSFLVLKGKQFLEPRINRGMLNSLSFLWEIKMAKGLCLVGAQWKKKGRAAHIKGLEYCPSRTEASEISWPLPQAWRKLSQAQVEAVNQEHVQSVYSGKTSCSMYVTEGRAVAQYGA